MNIKKLIRGYYFLVNIVRPIHHVIIQSKLNFPSNLWYINDININRHISKDIRSVFWLKGVYQLKPCKHLFFLYSATNREVVNRLCCLTKREEALG